MALVQDEHSVKDNPGNGLLDCTKGILQPFLRQVCFSEYGRSMRGLEIG